MISPCISLMSPYSPRHLYLSPTGLRGAENVDLHKAITESANEVHWLEATTPYLDLTVSNTIGTEDIFVMTDVV